MPSTWNGFQRGTDQPFIHFDSLPPLSTFNGTFQTALLGPGGVWIRSQSLASDAPPASLIGLRIDNGDISLDSAVPVVAGAPDIDITTRDLTLTLTLSQVSNQNSPISSVFAPTTTVWKFQAVGGRLELSQSLFLDVFGKPLQLTYLNASNAQHDSSRGRINIPFGMASGSDFSLAQASAKLLNLSSVGTPITGTYWSLRESDTLIDSSEIGENGGALIVLGEGLKASSKVYDSSGLQMNCGPSTLLADPNDLLLASDGFVSSCPKFHIRLDQRSFINGYGISGKTEYAFACHAGNENWRLQASTSISLDKPRTVTGMNISATGTGILITSQTTTQVSPSLILRMSGVDITSKSPNRDSSFALKILLLKTRPISDIHVSGTMTNGILSSGAVDLTADLLYAFPFLPDPYATNAVFNSSMPASTSPNSVVGPMTMSVTLAAGESTKIDVVLPQGALRWVSMTQNAVNSYEWDEQGTELFRGHEKEFRLDDASLKGPTLLDLSSNAAQFGLCFDLNATSTALQIQDLFMNAPLNLQGIVTLPTVEWEPVITKDAASSPGFPSFFDFPHSGPPGKLRVNSVNLVPVMPSATLGGILNAYRDITSNATIRAEFGMPCGTVALTSFSRTLFAHPVLDLTQPQFQTENMMGEAQVAIAGSNSLINLHQPQRTTEHLPGTAFMFKFKPSSLTASAPPMTILGIPGQVRDFNDDFGPNATRANNHLGPLVPLNRVDISGYGLSTFSEWQDYSPPTLPANDKVTTEVLLGRTEKYVVTQSYYCLPHFAKFTKIITMKRENNAIIERNVIYKPIKDGFYQYDQDPTVVTHPGLISSFTNFSNIRDEDSSVITLSNGTTLAPVLYNAVVTVEYTDRLGTVQKLQIPVTNHRGYVITGSTAGPTVNFGPAQYKEFVEIDKSKLDNTLKVGGPISCIFSLCGLKMMLNRVGVGCSVGPSGPQFAMGAWTMTEFPGMGEWSWLKLKNVSKTDPLCGDGDVVGSAGVPLIRQNSTLPTPYRFADPDDLLTTTPIHDYCILHATNSQRVIFPRPKIEVNGLNEITSLKTAWIADPFALAYGTGPFPKLQICIPTQDPSTSPASWILKIQDDNNLILQLPQASFDPPITSRDFQSSDIASIKAQHEVQSQISLEINSGAAIPWSFKFSNVSLVSYTGSSGNLTKLTQLTGTVIASTVQPATLTHGSFTVGGPLEPVFKTMAFLQNFGPTPPLEVSLTNDWSIWVGAKFGLDELTKPLDESVRQLLLKVFKELEIEVTSEVISRFSKTEIGIEALFTLPTPWEPLEWAIQVKFSMEFNTSVGSTELVNDTGAPSANPVVRADPPRGGLTVSLAAGAGLAVEFGVWKFQAHGEAILGLSVAYNTGSGSWAVGTSLSVKADITLIEKILSVGVEVEVRGTLYIIPCRRDLPTGGTRAGAMSVFSGVQVTIGVHVDLFLILSIEFEVQAEWHIQMNRGECRWEELEGTT